MRLDHDPAQQRQAVTAAMKGDAMSRSLSAPTLAAVPWRVAWVLVATVGLVGLDAGTPAHAQFSPRSSRYKLAVTDARRAMSKRELDDASKALKVASGNARSKEDKGEVARLESMLDYLRRFWQLLAKGTEEMKAGEEIKVKVTRSRTVKMAYVESVAGGVRMQVEGTTRLFRWKTMPTELVLALADKSLGKHKVSDVALGAFLAMDEKGDRKRARELWERAARSGVDVAPLLAELESAGTTAGKLPAPPAEKDLKAAEEAVKQKYRWLYGHAHVQSEQLVLARKLLADAPKVTDDDATRFVMLREARDLAAKAGDLRVAAAAVEQMAGFYKIDLLKMKVEMLRRAAEGAKGPRQFRDVVLLCLNLADEARQSRHLAEARQAVQIATEAARNSKSRALMQQAAAAEKKLRGR
jgi:hypothetical protein